MQALNQGKSSGERRKWWLQETFRRWTVDVEVQDTRAPESRRFLSWTLAQTLGIEKE